MRRVAGRLNGCRREFRRKIPCQNRWVRVQKTANTFAEHCRRVARGLQAPTRYGGCAPDTRIQRLEGARAADPEDFVSWMPAEETRAHERWHIARRKLSWLEAPPEDHRWLALMRARARKCEHPRSRTFQRLADHYLDVFARETGGDWFVLRFGAMIDRAAVLAKLSATRGWLLGQATPPERDVLARCLGEQARAQVAHLEQLLRRLPPAAD